MITRSGSLALPAALPLECGEVLHRPVVAYETYGELQGDNGILLLHGLSRSHRAAAEPGSFPYEPDGWFRDVIAPAGALDAEAYFVISANLIGSPFGSSSPASPDPSGRPYRQQFPHLTVTDMARAAGALARALGIRRLKAVVGVSLGGMVALRLAALFPDLVPSVAAIAAPTSLPDSVRGRLGLTRQILASDAAFHDGAYEDPVAVAPALRRVRLAALPALYGRDWLTRTHASRFGADRALEAEAEGFASVFDANAYAALCQAAAACDLSDSIEAFAGRALLVACATDDFAPPSGVREAYHALTAAGARASYWELASDAGHRAPYLESAKLNPVLREFLSKKL